MDTNNPEQVTPKGQMNKVEAILDQYERAIGLPIFQENQEDSDVQRYISMDRNSMEKLTLEDCAIAALALGGYSFYLQRALNRENARVNWASTLLKKLVAGKESQYNGSWDSQYHQVIKNDDYMTGILLIQQYAQQRANRVTYLATSIKNMSDLYVNLQKAKVMKG